MDLDTKNRRDL